VSANEPWEINQLLLIDSKNSNGLTAIQDTLLLENRDRDYQTTPITLKGQYDLQEGQMELSRFGIDLPLTYMITVAWQSMINQLGRPVVIGDIVELPSEVQYDHKLQPVKRWLEVTDAMWATEGYTPQWKPTLFKFYAQPLLASMEHRAILGTTPDYLQSSSDLDFLSGNAPIVTQSIVTAEVNKAEADDLVPETVVNIRELESIQAQVNPTSTPILDQIGPQIEDGIPHDGSDYTEGFTFPLSATDGDYHRLSYPPEVKLPTKLYRWSALKNRWLYMETDRRMMTSSHRPSIRNILSSATKKSLNE
jgi:hypothetical protein